MTSADFISALVFLFGNPTPRKKDLRQEYRIFVSIAQSDVKCGSPLPLILCTIGINGPKATPATSPVRAAH
jgi:hypothetical protein